MRGKETSVSNKTLYVMQHDNGFTNSPGVTNKTNVIPQIGDETEKSQKRRILRSTSKTPNDLIEINLKKKNRKVRCKIGAKYQVDSLPKASTQEHYANENPTSRDRIWDPVLADLLDQTNSVHYEIPYSLKEQGFSIIHQHHYNLDNTFESLRTIAPLDGSDWSQKERDQFHAYLIESGKGFHAVARRMGKTVKNILAYYYGTYKLSNDYQKFRAIRKQQMLKNDENDDECKICRDGGNLICCDSCNSSFHPICLTPPLRNPPEGDWFCAQCTEERKLSTSVISPEDSSLSCSNGNCAKDYQQDCSNSARITHNNYKFPTLSPLEISTINVRTMENSSLDAATKQNSKTSSKKVEQKLHNNIANKSFKSVQKNTDETSSCTRGVTQETDVCPNFKPNNIKELSHKSEMKNSNSNPVMRGKKSTASPKQSTEECSEAKKSRKSVQDKDHGKTQSKTNTASPNIKQNNVRSSTTNTNISAHKDVKSNKKKKNVSSERILTKDQKAQIKNSKTDSDTEKQKSNASQQKITEVKNAKKVIKNKDQNETKLISDSASQKIQRNSCERKVFSDSRRVGRESTQSLKEARTTNLNMNTLATSVPKEEKSKTLNDSFGTSKKIFKNEGQESRLQYSVIKYTMNSSASSNHKDDHVDLQKRSIFAEKQSQTYEKPTTPMKNLEEKHAEHSVKNSKNHNTEEKYFEIFHINKTADYVQTIKTSPKKRKRLVDSFCSKTSKSPKISSEISQQNSSKRIARSPRKKSFSPVKFHANSTLSPCKQATITSYLQALCP